MGTWECKNIRGSPPLHNSLGIFCWGDPSKYKEKFLKEVFTMIT